MVRSYFYQSLPVFIIAFIVAFFLTIGSFSRPTYTDSFYHYNAAVRFATGHGLTDEVVWTYLGQPEPDEIPVLETPSHLYWMPLTTLLSGVSMRLFGVTYSAAIVPNLILATMTMVFSYWLGYYIGGTRRHAILTFAVVMAGGYFVHFWGETDTFAPYAFVGSLCLTLLGWGTTRPRWWLYAVAGVLAGFGHLTRSDGLLLLMVGWLTLAYAWLIGFRGDKISFSQVVGYVAVFTLGYFLVMLPWFLRMIDVVGVPLPIGGTQAIWFTEYDDIFRFPPQTGPSDFFAKGLTTFFETRGTALINNLQIVFFIEGFVILTPFIYLQLRRRWTPFAFPVLLFALGLHMAMTLVFPMPGYRGGLLHGVIALLPFCAAYGIAGIDVAVEIIAKRRRHWKPRVAKQFFSISFTAIIVIMSAYLFNPNRREGPLDVYAELDTLLPVDARVMSSNPAELYFFTGRGGVTLMNEAPPVILDVANRYGVTHLLLEDVEAENGRIIKAKVPDRLEPVYDTPEFLIPIELDTAGARLYAIEP